jgi:hypothetical protein
LIFRLKAEATGQVKIFVAFVIFVLSAAGTAALG